MCARPRDGQGAETARHGLSKQQNNKTWMSDTIYIFICTHIRTHAHTHIGVNPNCLNRCDRGARVRGPEVDSGRERRVISCKKLGNFCDSKKKVYIYVHTHTTHSHTHAHTHARTHTHTHARTRTHTHTSTHPPTYAHTRTHARTHTHAHVPGVRPRGGQEGGKGVSRPAKNRVNPAKKATSG